MLGRLWDAFGTVLFPLVLAHQVINKPACVCMTGIKRHATFKIADGIMLGAPDKTTEVTLWHIPPIIPCPDRAGLPATWEQRTFRSGGSLGEERTMAV
jgi:hypothetical protein